MRKTFAGKSFFILLNFIIWETEDCETEPKFVIFINFPT